MLEDGFPWLKTFPNCGESIALNVKIFFSHFDMSDQWSSTSNILHFLLYTQIFITCFETFPVVLLAISLQISLEYRNFPLIPFSICYNRNSYILRTLMSMQAKQVY